MTKRLFAIAFSMFLFTAGASFASAQNWVNLGTQEVKANTEQDTFHIRSLKGQFRRIKLSVAVAPIKIERLEITYASGQNEQIEVRSLIRAGGSTRNIDLDGHDRFIRKVDVWYETASINPRKRARVTLWGLR